MPAKLPKKVSFYVILAILMCSAVLTWKGYTVLGVSTGFFTTLITIWKHYAGERSSQENESYMETQARMLLKSGSGNMYIQSIYDEMNKSGRAIDIGKRLLKALEIESDNEYALANLAVGHSLSMSIRQGQGVVIDPADVQYVRWLCRKGRKLYPDQSLFLDSLGTVADSVGKHRIARMWFEQSSKTGPKGNPGWRLSMATSYGMTGEHAKALQQLEAVQAEGVSMWLLDFYMGRTLYSLRRYNEALTYLHRARKQRRYHAEIVHWIHLAHFCQMHMAKSVYYLFVGAILHLISEPIYGLKRMAEVVFYALAIAYRRICQRIYLWLVWLWPSRAETLVTWLNPDMLEVDVAARMAEDKYFEGAESICRTGLEAIPESLRLSVNLVMSLAFQGKRDEALNEIEKALIRYPNNEVLLHNKHTILTHTTLNPVFVDAADLGNRSR